MTDLTGQQFGSYRLVRCLGVGGFASVYLGQHVRISSKQAAIKILDLHAVDVEQFRQEAETTERLVHPNIVRLLDFDIQGHRWFAACSSSSRQSGTAHNRYSVSQRDCPSPPACA